MLIIKIADFVTKYIYSRSDFIMVQSRGFIPYISNQKVSKNKIKYLPNTTENFYKPLSKKNLLNYCLLVLN